MRLSRLQGRAASFPREPVGKLRVFSGSNAELQNLKHLRQIKTPKRRPIQP